MATRYAGGARYTKGQKGPESRTRFTILTATPSSAGGGMARGTAIAHLRTGFRGVTFMVQGKNFQALKDQLVPDGDIEVMARWTGREAVTFTKMPGN